VSRTEGAPAELTEAVVRTLTQIRAEHERHFKRPLLDLFRLARELGFHRARYVANNIQETNALGCHFELALGERLFSLLPPELVGRSFPFHDVKVVNNLPDNRSILVYFDSLGQAPSRFGTIYYPQSRPTVVVDGQRKVVGFSRHAALCICERTVYDWRTYGGRGDAFWRLDGHLRYELGPLADGTAAGTFFQPTGPGVGTGATWRTSSTRSTRGWSTATGSDTARSASRASSRRR
jgi:hypothetical protein